MSSPARHLSVLETPSLEARLAERLARARRPDLQRLAREIVASASADEIDRLAVRGAMEILRGITARQRRMPIMRSVDRAARSKGGRELGLARIVVWHAGEYRWLAECDAPFLRGSADEDLHQAGELAETAHRKERLAQGLEEHGAMYVRDLPSEIVVSLWEGASEQ